MTENSGLNIHFSQRFSKNLLANIVYFILNIVIGLFMVPFFLNTLGSVAYALIPLATSLSSYLDLLISCINIAVSRFLTIDIHSNQVKKANITFNTALFGTLVILIILIPVAGIFACFSPDIFSVGDLLHNQVVIFFGLILASALITTWSGNFLTTLTAYNRFDYKNYVNIIRLGTQIILILVLFAFFEPALIFIGLAYFIASIIGLGTAYYYSRKTAIILTISPKLASFKRFKEVAGLAIWEATNSLSWYLVVGVALIIVNILFGAEAQTRYSFVTTWFGFILAMSGLLIPLFVPMIYNYYAKRDIEGMVIFSAFATKCMGIFLALPIALLCIFSPQIMTVWVGAEYADLAPLVWLVITPLIIKVQQSCLTAITTAYLKVHIKALIGIGLGIINIILACTLPFVFDMGVYGVAIAGAVTLFVMTGIVEPFYDAYLVHKSPMVFLKPMLISVCCFCILSVSGLIISNIFQIQSIIAVIVVSVVISIIYLFIVLKCLFSEEEKNMIRSCFPKSLGHFIPKWIL
jgi:membrane protein EpsK